MTSQKKLRASDGRQQRRPYQAPKLAAVALAADEVLVSNCKVNSATSAIAGNVCGIAGGCLEYGS